MGMLDQLHEQIADGLKNRTLTKCSRWANRRRIMGGDFPGPYSDKYHPWVREMHDSWAPFSLSFQDLVDQYLRPAMIVIANSVDRAILGRVHAFIGGPTDRAGVLPGLTTLARRSESSTGGPGTPPVLLRSSP